ncbi:MAG: WD40 repeat domain-containing protein [Treponema sp.]|jgi:hypothetical protein|nr:WD40 repeat domain-containing protein [Treponema sp.]
MITIIFFALYTFIITRHVPLETVLVSYKISSLEATFPAASQASLLPFTLGTRFGYFDKEHTFSINQERRGAVILSDKYWADFSATPEIIEIKNPTNQTICTIPNENGYPFFLDNRIFLLGKEQTDISAFNTDGTKAWTHSFAAPITTVDAKNGWMAVGLLDGIVEVLNDRGEQKFFFEPGGSRIPGIYGCALSQDASQLVIISGLDEQRFLVLNWVGNTYQVQYNAFLSGEYRREIYCDFIDNDNYIIFEHVDGLALYNIAAHSMNIIPLNGALHAVTEEPQEDLLFLITAREKDFKTFVMIQLPEGHILEEAPFNSSVAFLDCQESRLFIGGEQVLASLDIKKL